MLRPGRALRIRVRHLSLTTLGHREASESLSWAPQLLLRSSANLQGHINQGYNLTGVETSLKGPVCEFCLRSRFQWKQGMQRQRTASRRSKVFSNNRSRKQPISWLRMENALAY